MVQFGEVLFRHLAPESFILLLYATLAILDMARFRRRHCRAIPEEKILFVPWIVGGMAVR